ncbi:MULTISPECIES: MGMT family protein [unclassified Frigoribacterium]|uniref:MGMT family protein n=1 Tax=unclassified Frigoribacterium TaxID=2627005 RepID=UPI0009E68635|nr:MULTISPECIES: MGMT family protein [unclassified Frigoribacterium]
MTPASTPGSEPAPGVDAGLHHGPDPDPDAGPGRAAGPGPHPDDFASQVVAVVESIPPGHVMTYGSVAAALGSRASRGVGQVMAYAGADLPWWRVIRASGHAPRDHEQRALEQYRVEGTPLLWSRSGTFRVDLELASYRP